MFVSTSFPVSANQVGVSTVKVVVPGTKATPGTVVLVGPVGLVEK